MSSAEVTRESKVFEYGMCGQQRSSGNLRSCKVNGDSHIIRRSFCTVSEINKGHQGSEASAV